tara:strand:- start:240 stop:656 length:417 start_codon:yes stop_codon:yes gene_type:complete
MPLITFADKVDSKVSSSPLINKIVASDMNQLKNGVNSNETPYKSLVLLLNQTGTNAPVPTEVYNDTGEVFVWFYVSPGVYTITCTNAPFTVGKTVLLWNAGYNFGSSKWRQINTTIIEINTLNNDEFVNGSFELKIYN